METTFKHYAYSPIEKKETQLVSNCINAPYQIISFDPGEDPSLLEEASWFQEEKIILDTQNKRADNYSKQRFQLKDCHFVSLVKSADQIFGISSLYQRSFYGPDVARCLNRYYISPEYRNSAYSIDMRFPIEMVRHQLIQSKKMNLDFVFISLELFKYRWALNFSKILSQNTRLIWQCPEEAHLVCPAPRSLACWQHIIYTKIHSRPQKVFGLNQTENLTTLKKRFKKA